jgi:hypothetical protein
MLSFLLDVARRVRSTWQWQQRQYAAPSPHFVKQSVLRRHAIPAATWIETGTFKGDTTAFLACFAKHVVTIEPASELHRRAVRRFAGTPNVEVVNAISEKVMPELLPRLQGPVCFWLDGHFSGGATHQGPSNTPITAELRAIEQNLARLAPVAVLVDDVRCFGTDLAGEGYPPLGTLVTWAERNGLCWHIEHDIFVATTPQGTRGA